MPISIFLSTLTTLIIQTYFNKFPCIYIFDDDSNVNLTLKYTPYIPTVRTSLNFALNTNIFEEIKCQAFIVTTEDPAKDVELIEDKLHLNKVFRYNIRFYLLVYNRKTNETFHPDSVFNRDVYNFVVNVLLLVEQNGCVEFYTHYYSGSTPLKTKFIGSVCDSFNNSVLDLGLDLYEDKQKDLMGRELVVSTFNFIPYVNLETDRGAELSPINTFVKKYNYTRQLLVTNESWGEIYDNLTGYGAKYDIFMERAEIGAAGFFISEIDYKLDTSTYLIRTGLTFLVPVPKISNGLTTLLKPFHFVVWLMLLAILMTLVVAMKLLNSTNGNTTNNYNGQSLTFELSFIILGVLLQQPMNIRMKLFGCVVINFGMLLLVIFYNSGYSSIMTKPSYLPHISYGYQLETNHLPFYVIHDSYLLSVDELQYPNIKNNPSIVDPDELKSILSKTTDVSIAIDHLNLGYAFGDYDESLNISTLETFTVLKNDISFDWCVFPVYKHSAILPILDRFILQLRESGLDYYYLAEAFRDLNYEKSAYIRNIHTSHEPVTQFFNIKTLSGAFLMLILGLFLSAMIFFGEFKTRRHGKINLLKRLKLKNHSV